MKTNYNVRNKKGSDGWANCLVCRGSGILRLKPEIEYCLCDVGLVTNLQRLEKQRKTVSVNEKIDMLRHQLRIRAIKNVNKMIERLIESN